MLNSRLTSKIMNSSQILIN